MTRGTLQNTKEEPQKKHFLDYIENTLLSEIRKGDYVVMDNLRTHHCKGVEELIRSAGAIPLYLPPYCPDFNPIEKMWSGAICEKVFVHKEDIKEG